MGDPHLIRKIRADVSEKTTKALCNLTAESEETKDFVLYRRDFVIAGAF
jgi:hypothetical protein